LTGLLKISIPLNIWLWKSKNVAFFQLAIAVPGFALVSFVHRKMKLPLGEDVPCILIPAMLYFLLKSYD
jgi:hypothetical protein